MKGYKIIIALESLVLGLLLAALSFSSFPLNIPSKLTSASSSNAKSYIKWVDFDVTADAMKQALSFDLNSYSAPVHHNWIELLAYLGARYGGDFSKYRAKDMNTLVDQLERGTTLESLTADMKYYPYYLEAYSAVLGGMVGPYEIQMPDEAASAGAVMPSTSNSETQSSGSATQNTSTPQTSDSSPGVKWVTKYGLKAFSPIAKNFPYHDYDDFGVARSYGYRRQHLGHDMMGQVGTPIICVESGTVEAIGWNQYGGWRLGIRSFDQKRYYYYAHLRKNYPYHKSLQEGSIVQAGDVIGYLGRTGYSRTENTNNIDDPHLHFGLQLIFDESQKEGNNEIWIDCYELTRFLQSNRSETIKNQETKEYNRIYQMKDPTIPN